MSTYFTEDHEYLIDHGDGTATVGITHYAQDKLGDLVYIEQPEIGRYLQAGDDAAVIESVKAAAEAKAPIDGEVLAVNQAVVDDPMLVNAEPEGAGWLFKMKIATPEQLSVLLDADAYQKLIG